MDLIRVCLSKKNDTRASHGKLFKELKRGIGILIDQVIFRLWQGRSQPHSPGWAKVPISSPFSQMSINFSNFASIFSYFLPHFGPPGGRKGPGYATGLWIKINKISLGSISHEPKFDANFSSLNNCYKMHTIFKRLIQNTKHADWDRRCGSTLFNVQTKFGVHYHFKYY